MRAMVGNVITLVTVFCLTVLSSGANEKQQNISLPTHPPPRPRSSTRSARVSTLGDERAQFIKFLLRTRDNPIVPVVNVMAAGMVEKFTNFSSARHTIFLIPGVTSFGEGYVAYFSNFLTHAFLKNGDYNIISVDWYQLARKTFTLHTLQNAVFVGFHVAELINFLKYLYPGKGEYTIVAHHYGILSAAAAGSHLRGNLKKIIALDPQNGDHYKGLPDSVMLSTKSAKTVEVVHSSGYLKPLGHRDFYPNGGTKPQPGCVFDDTGYCSSQISIILFAIDVIKRGTWIVARNCDSFQDFLNHVCDKNPTISLWNTKFHKGPRGKFYFLMNGTIPTNLWLETDSWE